MCLAASTRGSVLPRCENDDGRLHAALRSDAAALEGCVVLMHASGSGLTAAVDMYNATSNSWTLHPIGLGQAREMLAAASLPDSGLVFFAGGVGPGV